uniref:Uncharacterized protein n=1 Tax=Rhizophora mucronata TaxID=61149 RepID=A0A2P2KJA3_RHIMU
MRQMKEKILSEMKLMIFQYHQIGDLPDFILLSLFVQWHHVQILSLQVIPMERASRWSLPCVLSHAYCLGVIRRIEWVESLKKHHPSSGEEGLLEWKKAIVECSNMTFAIATSEVESSSKVYAVYPKEHETAKRVVGMLQDKIQTLEGALTGMKQQTWDVFIFKKHAE